MFTAREARNAIKDFRKSRQRAVDDFIKAIDYSLTNRTNQAILEGKGFASAEWTYECLAAQGVDKELLFKTLEKYFTSLGYRFIKWDIAEEWAKPKIKIQWIWG